MKYLILLILLSSCGTNNVFNINNEALSYVRKFERISKISIKNLIVNVVALDNTKLGQCTPGSIPLIELNELYWNNGPYNRSQDRELLMFHELGHCILGRSHSKDTSSIMYPTFIGGDNYINNYNHYISELFNIYYIEGYKNH